MKEFRYIFKVDHTDPKGTLKHVGEVVAGDANAFLQGIDINFVNQQDFITAVPIEIALTMEMRAKVIYQVPDCRFVVTGVPVNRVANLAEYGYRIIASNVDVPVEEKPEKKEEIQKEEDLPEPREQNTKVNYYVEGKEVSKEEFNKKISELEKEIFKRFGWRKDTDFLC